MPWGMYASCDCMHATILLVSGSQVLTLTCAHTVRHTLQLPHFEVTVLQLLCCASLLSQPSYCPKLGAFGLEMKLNPKMGVVKRRYFVK